MDTNDQWWVYIIKCCDDSYYTGITTCIDRRFNEHSTGNKGAKYFNGRRPTKVVYQEGGHNRSTASIRESNIKKMTRQQKIKLIEKN